MSTRRGMLVVTAGLLVGLGPLSGHLSAQYRRMQGHPIGTVTTRGNLIVLELDSGAVAPPNLFDLAHRTLRLTPHGSGYQVENLTERWDDEIGSPIDSSQVTLKDFAFPFSGRRWSSFTVGRTGTISFGVPEGGARQRGGRFGRGGLTVGRFAQLRTAASTLVNGTPGIAVFLKPRMSGPRYVKELSDRVIVTWDLTEPHGGIFDFSWKPTVNWFQAVLHEDGTIDLTYGEMSAQDAIVGVYPRVDSTARTPLATITDRVDEELPAYEDLRNVRVNVLDGLVVQVAFRARGDIPLPGASDVEGVTYRATFKTRSGQEAVWTIRGGRARGSDQDRTVWSAYGPGLSPDVTVQGDTISMSGTLPEALRGAGPLTLTAEVATASDPRNPFQSRTVDRTSPRRFEVSAVHDAAADLSKLSPGDGTFPVVYEAFHWAGLPRTVDLACSVIHALGDRFDFLAWYSDFRVDNQEAGTPSTGPRGGPGSVTGINERGRDPAPYCSKGRLQWMFVQPVYIGSDQGQERSPDGTMTNYNYAMSQIGHELEHRWTADALAVVDGDTINLGPVHWQMGLQAPAAFPYSKPVEASAMGGGVWQDNHDGTYTQLDDNFFVPANGFSWLDLYVMGLAKPPEVPDFFLLTNLNRVGRDDQGQPVFSADKHTVTIQDVIAAMGPREPDFEHAQKHFNTGIVAVVMHGAQPSEALIERANAIGNHYVRYFERVTGHRATMTIETGGQ